MVVGRLEEQIGIPAVAQNPDAERRQDAPAAGTSSRCAGTKACARRGQWGESRGVVEIGSGSELLIRPRVAAKKQAGHRVVMNELPPQ